MRFEKNKKIPSKTGFPNSTPELLAPAGSLATWAAAVDAGADAVYLGMKSFSARAFANNFTRAELARVVELSHERGVKVFVAFNALLKESELSLAVKELDVLAKIGPDALILQDLGLFRIIKDHYPQFEVHASTLMAGHNAPGFQMLAELGFDRAVLPRELTVREVASLAERAPLGLELFIHGALCFSVSGLCLMSSFLGGKGSLRGACTQPCRRPYSTGRKKGYFFSPTDLQAIQFIDQIRNLPLAALKIEGRMKGPEYVSRVVRAYRLLLDAPESDLPSALAEAEHLIEASLGRHRSSGFLSGPKAPGGLSPYQAGTSGLFLGKITMGEEDGGLILLKNSVAAGDRLRVQSRPDDEQQAFSLKQILVRGAPVPEAEAGAEAFLAMPFPPETGQLVFKVDSGKGLAEALDSPLIQEFRSQRPNEPRPLGRAEKIIRGLESGAPRTVPVRRPQIWYRVIKIQDAAQLDQVRPDRIIVPVTTFNVKRTASQRARLKDLFQKLIWALPPVVFDSGVLGRNLSQLFRMGFSQFMVSNLGHLPLVRKSGKGKGRVNTVYADWRLNCLNTRTETVLADLGLAAITISLETDEENLKRILAHPGPVPRLLYLFGRPPLFTTRFEPEGLKDSQALESKKGERFRIHRSADFMVVFAEQPVFMAPLLKMRPLAGVEAFIVDLEHDPRPLVTAREVHEAIGRGRPLKNASRFNFKRGLF